MRRFDSAPDWLNVLAEQSLGDFEITPTLDATLTSLANTSRTDRASRDALFTALAFKVARFHFTAMARARASFRAQIDGNVFAQDAWLIFDDVLHVWCKHHSDSPGGFAFYFLRVYPLRLRGHLNSTLSRATQDVSLDALCEGGFVPSGTSDDALERQVEASTILDDISAGLPAADVRLLVQHRIALTPITTPRRTHYRRLCKATERARALALAY